MKLRKAFFLVLMVTLATVLVSCRKKISIDVSDNTTINLLIDEEKSIKFETNDKKGVTFESLDESVATVNDDGVVKGLKEGETTIKVISVSKEKVFAEVTIKVRGESDTLNLTLSEMAATILVGENYTIDYETNSLGDVLFNVTNELVASVTDEGVITGLASGSTTILVSLEEDSTVSKTFTINVTSDEEAEELELAIDMEYNLGYKASDGYTFEISNIYVASVNDEGLLLAELQGDATIEVMKDGNLVKTINLKVYNKARSVTLTGPENIYTNELISYEVSYLPRSAYPYYKFEVEDESILTINDLGEITPISSGTTILRVRSLQDDQTFDEIEVTIKTVLVVKEDVTEDEIIKLGNFEYKAGINLFSSINDAIENALEGNKVLLLAGNYVEDVTIDKAIILESDNAIIEGVVNVLANNVEINAVGFSEGAKVNVLEGLVSDFKFNNNTILNITADEFLSVGEVENFEIKNNSFDDLNTAINLSNLAVDINALIEKNTFNNVSVAMNINANNKLNDSALLRIYRNNIANVDNGFVISLSENNATSKATLYTRFNEVIEYDKAIVSTGPNIFEHTFNYWGEFDIANFDNVDFDMLLGYYNDPNDFVRETAYNPNVPILVTLENPIDELWLGETHELEIRAIPYSSSSDFVQIQVVNMSLAELENGRVLVPKKSGEFVLRVGSFSAPTEIVEHKIAVTTEPGIHLEIDNPTQDITVGSSFIVKGLPFPYDRTEDPVKYESTNPNVATVTAGGLVNVVGVGEFEIIASLVNEPIVKQNVMFTSYNELSDENILDFYTKRQLAYSKVHEIELHGASSYLRIHNESVTRVLAEDIESRERIIPVTPGFRPGIEMRSNIPEQFKYNEHNVVWVVVHDTGNSNAGAGAELHANYLWNAATQGGRQASWHYTIDSHLRYQHMPETEVAYHAGDGSSLPKVDGENPALGGGNSNGISIEMSVQRDGDVWKTWQNTARFAASLLHKYNLPLSNVTYHNDFSGKNCPQTLRRAGLIWLFEEFVENEYELARIFGNSISNTRFISHNPEILDDTGVIINTPNHSTNVSYTLEVEINGETVSKTFTTLVEGLWR